METVRDLNMDADEMQVVLSAISSVSRRIKEVAQTHKPLLGGEHFLTERRCASGCTSAPAPCKTIETERLFPTRSLQERFSTRLRTWKGYWRRILRNTNKNRL